LQLAAVEPNFWLPQLQILKNPYGTIHEPAEIVVGWDDLSAGIVN